MTDQDHAKSGYPLDTLADDIKGRIRRAQKHQRDADEMLMSAGIMLIELKKRVLAGEADCTWPAYLLKYCGMSRSWADKLIAVAMGYKTLEQLRWENALGNQEHRDRQKAAREKTERSLRERSRDADLDAAREAEKTAPTAPTWEEKGQSSAGETMADMDIDDSVSGLSDSPRRSGTEATTAASSRTLRAEAAVSLTKSGRPKQKPGPKTKKTNTQLAHERYLKGMYTIMKEIDPELWPETRAFLEAQAEKSKKHDLQKAA